MAEVLTRRSTDIFRNTKEQAPDPMVCAPFADFVSDLGELVNKIVNLEVLDQGFSLFADRFWDVWMDTNVIQVALVNLCMSQGRKVDIPVSMK